MLQSIGWLLTVSGESSTFVSLQHHVVIYTIY